MIPASQWSRYHVWPTHRGLKRLIDLRKRNGFERVCSQPVKRGQWLIDEAAFFEWARGDREEVANV